MANELKIIPDPAISSGTLTARILDNQSAQVWDADAEEFTTFNADNTADYAIAMTQTGTLWKADFPTAIITAGVFQIEYYNGTVLRGFDDLYWDGSREVIPPTAPVSLIDAKIQCSVDIDDDAHDTILTDLVTGCTEYAEMNMNRTLITRQRMKTFWQHDQHVQYGYGYGWHWNHHSRWIPLDGPPIQTIDSVTIDGDEIDADKYELRTIGDQSFCYLKIPGSIGQPIVIIYTAGYGTSADVPMMIKRSILAHVEHLWRNRGVTTERQKYAVAHGLDAIHEKLRAGSLIG